MKVERMDEDAPVLVDVGTIVRKEQARVKQARLIRKLEMKCGVGDGGYCEQGPGGSLEEMYLDSLHRGGLETAAG